METLGSLGLWLGAGGGVLLVAELAIGLPRWLRFRRQLLTLQRTGVLERTLVIAELARLEALSQERERLLRPLRALRRILLHPLTIALLRSYRRRRLRT